MKWPEKSSGGHDGPTTKELAEEITNGRAGETSVLVWEQDLLLDFISYVYKLSLWICCESIRFTLSLFLSYLLQLGQAWYRHDRKINTNIKKIRQQQQRRQRTMRPSQVM